MSNAVENSLTSKADAAFQIAMRKVLSRARQAGHGILTWRNGRVTEISCDEAERLLEERNHVKNGEST